MATLETYQGVLGLAWSGHWAEAVGSTGQGTQLEGTHSALQGFCGSQLLNRTQAETTT